MYAVISQIYICFLFTDDFSFNFIQVENENERGKIKKKINDDRKINTAIELRIELHIVFNT